MHSLHPHHLFIRRLSVLKLTMGTAFCGGDRMSSFCSGHSMSILSTPTSLPNTTIYCLSLHQYSRWQRVSSTRSQTECLQKSQLFIDWTGSWIRRWKRGQTIDPQKAVCFSRTMPHRADIRFIERSQFAAISISKISGTHRPPSHHCPFRTPFLFHHGHWTDHQSDAVQVESIHNLSIYLILRPSNWAQKRFSQKNKKIHCGFCLILNLEFDWKLYPLKTYWNPMTLSTVKLIP